MAHFSIPRFLSLIVIVYYISLCACLGEKERVCVIFFTVSTLCSFILFVIFNFGETKASIKAVYRFFMQFII